MIKKYCNAQHEVAVIYSPGYGAGFTTWMHDDDMSDRAVFDYDLVMAILNKDKKAIIEIADSKNYPHNLDTNDLDVLFVPMGCQFRVTEYDGYESIEILEPSSYRTA